VNSDGQLIEMVARSETFQNFKRAFKLATGLPVALRAVTTWQLPFHGHDRENAFCAVVAGKSRACAACLRFQEKLAREAMNEPATRICPYGLRETAVPVKIGAQTIGFLQTGHVLHRQPTRASYQRVVDRAAKLAVDIGNHQARRAFFQTPVASPRKCDAVTELLAIFADHLAAKSNELVMQAANTETRAIAGAKQFIREHYTEALSLQKVSSIVNTSSFYFSKQFRKVTGMNFTEFVSRTRIEKAKNSMLNPKLRIGEIGYETGFQSPTHFNRVFRRIVGQSPTEYRDRLAGTARPGPALPSDNARFGMPPIKNNTRENYCPQPNRPLGSVRMAARAG